MNPSGRTGDDRPGPSLRLVKVRSFGILEANNGHAGQAYGGIHKADPSRTLDHWRLRIPVALVLVIIGKYGGSHAQY